MKSQDYNLASRLLHKSALSPLMSELCFDLESAVNRVSKDKAVGVEKPLFISGLARAGTSLLLRMFDSTEHFRSLTYRDMPFVMMPNLWSKLSRPFQKSGSTKERAHGDGVMVDYESVEAFDEVFWRTFDHEDYVKEESLLEYKPDQEVIEKFRVFVRNLLKTPSKQQGLRYLSKNNNNLLRLPAIRESFSEGIILIPFRDPMQQAYSLYTQHQRFVKEHAANPFSLDYMNMLGHYEFGANHKPFCFENEEWRGGHLPEKYEYWVEYWTYVYQSVVSKAPENSIFVSYEQLCAEPVKFLDTLFTKVLLPKEKIESIATMVTKRMEPELPSVDSCLRDKAYHVYESLQEQSL